MALYPDTVNVRSDFRLENPEANVISNISTVNSSITDHRIGLLSFQWCIFCAGDAKGACPTSPDDGAAAQRPTVNTCSELFFIGMKCYNGSVRDKTGGGDAAPMHPSVAE